MLEWFERTETATGYPNAFRICKVSSLKVILFLLSLCLLENQISNKKQNTNEMNTNWQIIEF